MDQETQRADRLPIPSISKSLDHAGEATTPMEDWMFIFDRYITIVNANRTTALTSSEKNSLLFMYLGREGSRIMNEGQSCDEQD